MTIGWSADIEKETLGNTSFRTTLFTGTQTEHPDGTVHVTTAEADAAETEHHGH